MRIGLVAMLAAVLGSAPGFAQEETVGDGVEPSESTESSNGPTATDISSVRVHTGGAANSPANEIGAQAYTNGPDVSFQHSPTGNQGMVAHELAHVVQQQSTATEPAETEDAGKDADEDPNAPETRRRRMDRPETRRRTEPE